MIEILRFFGLDLFTCVPRFVAPRFVVLFCFSRFLGWLAFDYLGVVLTFFSCLGFGGLRGF